MIITVMGFSKNLLTEDGLGTILKDKCQTAETTILQDESFLLIQNKTIVRMNFNFK